MFEKDEVVQLLLKQLRRNANVLVVVLATILSLVLGSRVTSDLFKTVTKEFPAATPQLGIQASPNVIATESAKVARVIDGDTIELETGEKVRYIGIDAPETHHPQQGLECFGKESTEHNRELVEGKEVRLEKDISKTDRYGRLLRYVYVHDEMVNELLVRDGFAHASSYPPDIKYQERFRAAEKEAQEQQRGLWKQCDTSPQTPLVE